MMSWERMLSYLKYQYLPQNGCPSTAKYDLVDVMHQICGLHEHEHEHEHWTNMTCPPSGSFLLQDVYAHATF